MIKKIQERHFLMKKALRQAQKAFEADEVPVGALVIDAQGTILARAYNQVESKMTQTAHAELLALRKAGKKLGDWRLEGCWMYVTLEPCSMCFSAIVLSRMGGVVYGASSPLFGYRTVLDKLGPVSLYNDRSLPLQVIEGIDTDESSALLQKFFKIKRKKRE
jgi:tRNA(adenine34) deaminase